ncbi:MAG: VirB3 family type IV secretion system protein [Candidatus Aminicenantes bacterium]|nr:VirB3 family type IV secretion system protein [Candidatus Aminicenantes bacterium]
MNRIYNCLNHEPLVWGIPFKYLMVNIILLILSTMVLTRIYPVWVGIPVAFGITVVIYLALLKFARTDKIEIFYGRFQRAVAKEIDSLSKSKQRMVVR